MEVINDYSIVKLKNIVNDNFNINYDNFCQILRDNNAILSGSSVLKVLFREDKWDVSDLDVYVNAKNYIPVRDFLFKNCLVIQKRRSDGYCRSFLSKNKIIDVCTFQYKLINDKIRSIDLMSVRNTQDVVNVVKNFDLTCCQNYFDGRKVYSFDLENTLEFKTKLNPEYLSSLSTMNNFTCKRIKKYIQRGFNIDIGGSLHLNEDVNENKDKFDIKKYVNKIIFYSTFKVGGKWNLQKQTDFRNIFYMDDGFDITKTHQFSMDGYDSDDFNSTSDYTKIGKENEYINVIKMFKNTLSVISQVMEDSDYSHPQFHLGYIFVKYINEIKNELDLHYKLDREKYEEFKHINAFDLITFEDKSITEFLESNSDNIIIKFADKYENYNRTFLYNYTKEKKTKINNNIIYRLLNNSAILSGDLPKLNLEDIYFYELINSGIVIGGSNIYTLIPYSTNKFIEKYA